MLRIGSRGHADKEVRSLSHTFPLPRPACHPAVPAMMDYKPSNGAPIHSPSPEVPLARKGTWTWICVLRDRHMEIEADIMKKLLQVKERQRSPATLQKGGRAWN